MPDDTNEKAYTVSGNIPEIKTQLMQLKNENRLIKKLLEGLETGGSSSQKLPYYVKGKAYIKIAFKGTIQNTSDPYRIGKFIRLMKLDPGTVTLEKIQQYANKVKSKFNNFSFTTGHDSYCYNNSDQGLTRSWGFFNSQADAQKVFEQILDIDDHSPEWQCLSKTIVPMPGSRFNEPPEKVLQAGINIRSERERPIALMKFHKAYMKLPKYKREFVIVDTDLQIIEALPFIAD